MIDIVLLILSILLVISGMIGCILPVLPGPPLSFIGMLLLHFTKYADFNNSILWVFGSLTILVTVIDYIIPIWGTKKFGGSKRGIIGASLGLLIGLFIGPIGIIFGPFLGALIAELTGGKETEKAFKAAFGAFVGILVGTIFKLIVSGLIMFYFFKELFFNF